MTPQFRLEAWEDIGFADRILRDTGAIDTVTGISPSYIQGMHEVTLSDWRGERTEIRVLSKFLVKVLL